MVKEVLADQCDEETWGVVVVVMVMRLIMAVVVADEVEVEADVVVVVVVIKVHRGLHGTKIANETLCVQIFY
jgi:hypothetical protein